MGVELAFKTQRAASPEVARQVARAQWLKCFLARGNEFTRDTFASLWQPDSTVHSIDLLFPDPETATDGSWFVDRMNEVGRYDPGYRSDLVVNQVRSNIKYSMDKSSGDDRVKIRAYDFPHLARLVITDRVAFLTVFSDRPGHGAESRCIMVTQGSVIYNFCMRIFDKVWSEARVIA